MDASLDEDEFKFTLFSDIEQNVLAMREQLHEKVSEALREEIAAEVSSENFTFLNETAEIYDDGDDEDEDDIPLQIRVETHKVNKPKVNNPKRNCPSRRRRGAKRSPDNSAPIDASEISEVACKNVETIDLIDSDCELQTSLPNYPSLNNSFNYSTDEITIDDNVDDEDDAKLVSVKINWMNVKVHRFELRKFQKFTTVFEQLAQMENVAKERILLILRDKIFVSQDDSPDSLKLSIVDIIEGGITKERVDNKFKRKCDDGDEEDTMVFKCVMKDRKKPLLVSIKKTNTMKRLMVKVSEELECSLDKLKFMFEGEELDGAAKPEDLDLEGGEVFHIHIKP